MPETARQVMPFIVGSPRSGTTLLRFMLAAHSDLAIPPETGFPGHIAGDEKLAGLRPAELLRIITDFPPSAPAWRDFGMAEETLRRALFKLNPFSVAEGIRSFYQLYASRHGKRRVGDKTPSHGEAMIAIECLLPEAAFIHVIRDGRDSSFSLRDMWFAPSQDIAVLAAYWRDNVTRCRRQGRSVQRYLEVRYEDLLSDTPGQLRRVCDFVDLPFEARMLAFYEDGAGLARRASGTQGNGRRRDRQPGAAAGPTMARDDSTRYVARGTLARSASPSRSNTSSSRSPARSWKTSATRPRANSATIAGDADAVISLLRRGLGASATLASRSS